MASGGVNHIRLAPVGMRNGKIDESISPFTQPKAQNRQDHAPTTTVQARIPSSTFPAESSGASFPETATVLFDSVAEFAIFATEQVRVESCCGKIANRKAGNEEENEKGIAKGETNKLLPKPKSDPYLFLPCDGWCEILLKLSKKLLILDE